MPSDSDTVFFDAIEQGRPGDTQQSGSSCFIVAGCLQSLNYKLFRQLFEVQSVGWESDGEISGMLAGVMRKGKEGKVCGIDMSSLLHQHHPLHGIF